MGGSLLITRPEHDVATYYLSRWSEIIIIKAKEKGINVIDLHRGKANRKRVIGTLKKVCPRLIILNGHGSDVSVQGHDNEIILDERNKEVIKDKIIYARSCRSARILGEISILHGVEVYLGYKEDFILFFDPTTVRKPLEDKTAELFLKPSNYIPISLLKGHTAGEANDRSKNLFRKNIEKLIIEGPSSDNYYAIRYLLWDMTHQVCLGDRSAIF